MRSITQSTPRRLLIISIFGLAALIPFTIAGANAAIMLGFLATLASAIGDGRARGRYRLIGRDPMLYASALLVLSALPSVLISSELGRALRDLKSYWILLVYFLAAHSLFSDRVRQGAFWVLFASTSVSSLVALVQYGGGLDLWFLRIAPQTYRPGSTLYNMTFAGILYQLIALNAAVALSHKPWSGKFIGLGTGIVIQVTALFLTLTRGAWLALAAGMASLPLLLRRRRLFLVLIAVAALATIAALENDVIRERALTIVENIRDPSDKNIATRLVLWDIAWQVFKENPIFGAGMGDYTLEAQKLLDGRFVKTTVDAHNIYLHLLATRGLFGFIPFVAFWVVLFRVLFAARRRAEEDGDRFGTHAAAGVIAAAVAVLFGALSENNVDDSEVFTCFMFLAGLARSLDVSASIRERAGGE